MTSPRCEWSWMAEALDDGRLREEERAAFERHVTGCTICRRATDDVAWLRQRLDALPQASVSDFDHRRERDRLLGRAARLSVSGVRRTGAPAMRLQLVLVALCLLAVGGAARLALRRFGPLGGSGGDIAARAATPAPAETPAPGEPPRYEVTALAHGDWSTEETGATARIILTKGSAAFHVHHLGPGQRFLVTLPDGEIEVRGTRFVVDVDRGSTRYVVVIEGKVAFRRDGAPEALLLGGQRWDAPAATSATNSTTSGAAAASATGDAASGLAPVGVAAPVPPARALPGRAHQGPSSQRTKPGAPRTRTTASLSSSHRHAQPATRAATPARPGRSAPAVPEATGPTAPDASPSPASASGSLVEANGGDPRAPTAASERFARAMQAFQAGRYDDADGMWRDFLARYPDDPRAEDAAFLRMVGRSRDHDPPGAAEMARRYLAQFPRGLRHHEAELVIRQAP